MKPARFVISLLLLSSSTAWADSFALLFEKDFLLSLNPRDRAKVEEFRRETESAIPEGIRNSIGRPIKIKLTEFKSDTPELNHVIYPPQCVGEKSQFEKKDKFGQLHAQVRAPGLFDAIKNASEIRLNRLFLNEILLGKEHTRTYGCGHRSIYRLAQASVIHEIFHIHDDKEKISDRVRFKKITGFYRPIYSLFDKNKNQRSDRSPDVYEREDTKEAFAVNLEYYSLDPNFRCRRPLLQKYFEETVGSPQKFDRSCSINHTVSVTDSMTGSVEKVNLDPKRLYSVDYLLAANGDGFDSFLGHTMIRLVMCHPNRPKVGPDCRKDIGNHVVLSYRANVTDSKLSIRKGLFGGYSSLPFLLSMNGVIDEYTHRELREIKSVSIKMDEEERRDFAYRVLQENSEYKGDYFFISRNCSTESEDSFKSTLRTEDVSNVNALSPKGLYNDLFNAGLLDGVDKDGNLIAGKSDLFKVQGDRVLEAFGRIRSFAENSKIWKKDESGCADAVAYTTKTSAENRKAFFELLDSMAITDQQRIGLLSDLYNIEQEIVQYHSAQYAYAIRNVMEEYREDPKEFRKSHPEYGDVLEELQSISEFEKSLELPRLPGYGIPLSSERRNQADPIFIAQAKSAIAIYGKFLMKIEEFKASQHDKAIRGAQENYDLFGDKLIETSLRLEEARDKSLIKAALLELKNKTKTLDVEGE